MGRFAESKSIHLVLLALAMGLCTFPNLGAHSLWDVDEGVNAEAAREMIEAGTWIVPTFNYELRTAKPVMLYWWQMLSYNLFGMSEWSARLPSVLAGFGSVLFTYLLARKMFDPLTGLFSGLLLTTAIEFCLLSHTASPDSLLLFFTMLAFYSFWRYSQNGSRAWFFPMATACALAVLTKGPIGVGLPGLVVLVYFTWNRETGRLWDRRLIHAGLIFLLIALPWYVLVGIETRGQFLKVFFGRENLSRFTTPMENHSGNPFFHLIALFVGFAPGSIFILLSFWEGGRLAKNSNSDHRAYRFLLCWFAVYLAIFSVAATKLPNYVLPLYPATAILCGRMIERWRSATFTNYRWAMPASLAGLAFVGIVTGAGLLIAGGAVTIPVKKMRIFEGLESSAWIGLLPLLGAGIAGILLRKHYRNGVLATVAIASVGFTACIAAFPILKLDDYKAARCIVEEGNLLQRDSDIRIASLYWFKPSTVFYAQREIRKLEGLDDVQKFLGSPRESYLLIAEPSWNEIAGEVKTPTEIVAKHYDFYENKQILVIANTTRGERRGVSPTPLSASHVGLTP